MQWSAEPNAGFSRAAPDRLYAPVIDDPVYGYQAVNVAAQERQPNSLLNWMRRLIAARKSHSVLARGALAFVETGSRQTLAFVRVHDDQAMLCAFNLSGAAQPLALPLDAYEGRVPVDVFGGTRFPRIGSGLYSLTLPAYSFLWFRLEA